jgi:hypothetical protein
MADELKKSMDRRDFLRKAAIAGGVVWAGPVIQTVAATPAYATHSPITAQCEHSPPQGGAGCGPEGSSATVCESCVDACQSKGSAPQCAVICNAHCGPCVGTPGTCCAEACTPACFSGSGSSVCFACEAACPAGSGGGCPPGGATGAC